MDGAGFLPERVPSHWGVFFGAEDVDKTLRVIADNGGAVLRDGGGHPIRSVGRGGRPDGRHL